MSRYSGDTGGDMIFPVTFLRRGLYLSHESCEMKGVCFPRIPRIMDVLYLMHLTGEQRYFYYGRDNYPAYISNLGMVVAAVGEQIFNMRLYDESAARKIIAQAIIEMCPPEARCLLEPDYVRTLQSAEDTKYPLEILQTTDENILKAECMCSSCSNK